MTNVLKTSEIMQKLKNTLGDLDKEYESKIKDVDLLASLNVGRAFLEAMKTCSDNVRDTNIAWLGRALIDRMETETHTSAQLRAITKGPFMTEVSFSY